MISKITNDIIEKFIDEFNKKENKIKIFNNIIEPITQHMLNKIYPYILISCILFSLTIIIFIITIIYIIKKI
jgi:hypothetical protein